MSKQRFYIATSGNDDVAYKEAMQHACALSRNDSEIKKVVLLIHTKIQTGWFERLFDGNVVKQLFNGMNFEDCNPVFKIETKKTYRDSHTPSEIVITCGLDDEDVSRIDNFYSVMSIIAIPWLANGIDKWVQTWNPREIRGKQQALAAYPEPSCIAQRAMRHLSDSINMATGITHPYDNEQAKTYILALHKYETVLDADIVGAYLVSKLYWDTGHAKQVENLIKTLNAGKHFQGGSRTGLQNYYNQWKKECG